MCRVCREYASEWRRRPRPGTTEQTDQVLGAGALPRFVGLLAVPDANADLLDNCIWALGNIAGDSAGNRDRVLEALQLKDGLEAVLGIISAPVTDTNEGRAPQVPPGADPTPPLPVPRQVSMRRNAVWMLSNLCRGEAWPGCVCTGRTSMQAMIAP